MAIIGIEQSFTEFLPTVTSDKEKSLETRKVLRPMSHKKRCSTSSVQTGFTSMENIASVHTVGETARTGADNSGDTRAATAAPSSDWLNWWRWLDQ